MITVSPIKDNNNNLIAINIIVDGQDNSLLEFKELIQRGSNLWPDAIPEIKEFADIITNDIVLQDYNSQAFKPRIKHRFVHLCSCGFTTYVDATIQPVRVKCFNPKGCKFHDVFNGV